MKGRISTSVAVAAPVAGLLALAAANAAASRGKATAAPEIVAARFVFSETVLTDRRLLGGGSRGNVR